MVKPECMSKDLGSLLPRLLANCVKEEKREPGMHVQCMRMCELSQPTDVNEVNKRQYMKPREIHCITITTDPQIHDRISQVHGLRGMGTLNSKYISETSWQPRKRHLHFHMLCCSTLLVLEDWRAVGG